MLPIISLPSEDPDVAIFCLKCFLWNLHSFLEGGCVRVTGLSENLGDMNKMCILTKILYMYFEIKVFKAQM